MENLRHTFNTLWYQFSDILPTFLIGIAILIGGWLIAKLISKIVLKVLEKTKDSKIASSLSMNDISEKLNFEISLLVNLFSISCC